jgi:putative transposase
LYSRKVVGWDVSDSLKSDSVLSALKMALKARNPSRGLLIHSDRGVQYCCNAFRDTTERHGFIQSMSRKGNCWDNAVAESFFSTLKTEMVDGYVFNDLQDAEIRLFDYIEVFYNKKRLHSTLGYKSPEMCLNLVSVFWGQAHILL